jgi:uncharacterized membrane protein YhhN
MGLPCLSMKGHGAPLWHFYSNLLYDKDMSAMHIFFAIFAVVSVIHIASLMSHNERFRVITKIFLIPPLLAAYIAGTENVSLFPVLALIFGWIGDILLTKIRKREHFKLGLVSFLLGHIFYIISFMQILGFFTPGGGSFSFMTLAISGPLAIILGITIFRIIKPVREMAIPVAFYTVVIEIMALWGLQVFVFHLGLAGALVFFGCLCFMFSDVTLSYRRFRKAKFLGPVMVMVTYLVAQAMIIVGIMLL